MAFNIHSIYRQIFKIWRKRRFQLFLDLLQPKPTDVLLDVGGYPGFWVEIPAYECPIEPHYIAPFIHYLPPAVQKKIIPWCTVWGWMERPNSEAINSMVETTRLLRKSEMCELFPDCKILTERLLWIIPKSYIAVRRND